MQIIHKIDSFLYTIFPSVIKGDQQSLPYKQREMVKFQKSQEQIGINMAVAMFMIDALQFFEAMPKEEIKKIAIEIAMQGNQGYRPDKDNYRINSIKDKTFQATIF